MQPERLLDPIPRLKLLHQIHPNSPHARPLPKDIHGDTESKQGQLDAAEGEEDLPAAVGLKPGGEEKAEDEAMEDVL